MTEYRWMIPRTSVAPRVVMVTMGIMVATVLYQLLSSPDYQNPQSILAILTIALSIPMVIWAGGNVAGWASIDSRYFEGVCWISAFLLVTLQDIRWIGAALLVIASIMIMYVVVAWYMKRHELQSSPTNPYAPIANSVDPPADGVPCVYLLTRHDRLWKIGYSANARKRITAIQSKTGVDIALVAWRACPSSSRARALERSLHQEYGTYRMRGEWFRLPDEIANNLSERLGPVTS